MDRATDADATSAYEAMAAEYAEAVEESPFNALYERPGVISPMPDVAGKRVLDVGCGSGPLSAWLVHRGAEVVGFDISPSMVGLAQKRGLRRATFRVADLAKPLEFLEDASLDGQLPGDRTADGPLAEGWARVRGPFLAEAPQLDVRCV